MFVDRNYNKYIDEYLNSIKDKSERTCSRTRVALNKIYDLSRENVFEFLKDIEKEKLSSRRVTKSTYKKFFEYVQDNEMLRFLGTISNDEIESVNEDYFFDISQVQKYILEKDTNPTRKKRTYIYAYLLFIGICNKDIRKIDIYEFDETSDTITHDNHVYNIKPMDLNCIIHNALVDNKYAKGIDYESGDYVRATGNSRLVKTLQGTLFLRTALSEEGGVAANTALSNNDRQLIARSGAFIRFYNLKKRTKSDTKTLLNSLDDELMRIINRHAILSEYESFEKQYKDFLSEKNKTVKKTNPYQSKKILTGSETMYDRICEIVNKKGLKPAIIERTLGWGNGSFKAIKTSSPSVDKIMALASYLNVSIDYLITGIPHTDDLSRDELRLMETFRSLSENNKIRLIERAESLLEVDGD